MKLNLTDKDIIILKIVSQISGGFTLVVALTMIFSLVQLKTLNPLDNPVLLSLKDQFDKDPENKLRAEQVRAMDLVARKAYFTSRWQVESGSYLLLAGAIVFILCQRLISGNEKPSPLLSDSKPDENIIKDRNRKYLLAMASVIFVVALTASFIMRNDLPDPYGQSSANKQENEKNSVTAPKPDKTNFPSFRGQNSHGIAGGRPLGVGASHRCRDSGTAGNIW